MSILFQAYPLARQALFALDAETAHETTLHALQKAYDCSLTRGMLHSRMSDPFTLMGLPVLNRVGLAAGLDKNGAHIDAMGNLGFGFIEVGTVTPRAQPGNPKPRMFRIPQAQALINRLGFNNLGLDTFLANVARSTWRSKGGIVGLNIGKNADTPIEQAVNDYLIGLTGVYPHADYITVNISSPNTKNLRALQGEHELDDLLSQLQRRRLELAAQYGRLVPLAVKIAPDLTEEQIDIIAQVLPRHGIDGVIGDLFGEQGFTAELLVVDHRHHPALIGGDEVVELELRVVQVQGHRGSPGGCLCSLPVAAAGGWCVLSP